MSPPNNVSLTTPIHWHIPIAQVLLDKIYRALFQRLNIVNPNYPVTSLEEIRKIYSHVMLQLEKLVISFDNGRRPKTGDITQNQVALNILCFLQLFLEKITTPILNPESAFAVILKTETIKPIDLALIFGGAISNKEKLAQQREAIRNKTFTPIAAKQFYFLLLQLAISHEREVRHAIYNNEILDNLIKELGLTLMPVHDQNMLNITVMNLPLATYQDQNKYVERFLLGQFEKPVIEEIHSIATHEKLAAKFPDYFGAPDKMGAKETLLRLIGQVSTEDALTKTPEHLWKINELSRSQEEKTNFERDLKFLRQVHKVLMRAAFMRTWQVEFWASIGYGAYQRGKLPVLIQEWCKLTAGNGHNIKQMLADWTMSELGIVNQQLLEVSQKLPEVNHQLVAINQQLFEIHERLREIEKQQLLETDQPLLDIASLEAEAKSLEVNANKLKATKHNVFILENRIAALKSFNQQFAPLMPDPERPQPIEQPVKSSVIVSISWRSLVLGTQTVPRTKVPQKHTPASTGGTSDVPYHRRGVSLPAQVSWYWPGAQKSDKAAAGVSITTTIETTTVSVIPQIKSDFKMSGSA